MFRNFVLSAHRNVIRNKVQSIIQVLSLAIGITVFALIGIYLFDEYSVERSNPYHEDVYRIEDHSPRSAGNSIYLYMECADYFAENIPEITALTRIYTTFNRTINYLEDPERPGIETILAAHVSVDSGFFDVFPQEFLFGSPETAFEDPNAIVLTERIAKILFNKDNPIGKTVYLGTGDKKTVTGVIRNPLNTHLKFDALNPLTGWIAGQQRRLGTMDIWAGRHHQSPFYIRLATNSDTEHVEEKIQAALLQWLEVRHPTWVDRENNYEQFIGLRSLTEVPFSEINPRYKYMNLADTGKLRILIVLAVGILLLAIINYINLTSARASLRAREIAIRKISGSSRSKLILYFLTESIVTTFFAFLVAITMIQLVYNQFVDLLQADINLYFLSNPLTWIVTVFGIILIGILAGIYPAIKLSSASPLAAFSGSVSRGKSREGGEGLLLRRILMLGQFTSAVILIISLQVMHSQLRYMQHQELGFNKENIVWKGIASAPRDERLRIKEILKRYDEIEHVSLSSPSPGSMEIEESEEVTNPDDIFFGMERHIMYADPEFFKLYNLDLVMGNENLSLSMLNQFSEEESAQDRRRYIVNETFWKVFKNADTETESYKWWEARILGVVKDFHFQSLKQPIKPLVIEVQSVGKAWHIAMKVNSRNPERTLDKIWYDVLVETGNVSEEAPAGLRPDIKLRSVEKDFDRLYEEDYRIRTATTVFSLLAILVAILGLFGLSTFIAQRRTKEVGIRKVLGATNNIIFLTLARDFLKWVIISLFIGLPLGWYIMDKWLEDYAYKTQITPWMFLMTTILVLFVAFATIAWHSFKSSRSNPVDALKFE